MVQGVELGNASIYDLQTEFGQILDCLSGTKVGWPKRDVGFRHYFCTATFVELI